MQNRNDALICAAVLDGKGGARELSWDDINRWQPADGVLWLHFHLDDDRVQQWIEARSGLDAIVSHALLMHETRPRAVVSKDGLMLILRGVNLNPGSDPEDMVSIRIWADANRVITVRRRRLMATQDLIDAFAEGNGPRSASEIIVRLTDNLTARMAPVIADIHERLEELEEEVLSRRDAEMRGHLSELRRQIIRLRRFIAPQRETLIQLSRETISWFSAADMAEMRETAFAITRHLEDLDMAREQAIVTHDELTAFVNEQLGRTMYFLALVTTFFLPITFITGLMGMNVGGLPGAPAEKYPYAFLIVVAGMAVILAVQAWIFRRWQLMK
jgi:zinc transporter